MNLTTAARLARRYRRQRGMTLIEIIVVITIIGMIAAAVAVGVMPRLAEAREDVARQGIHAVLNAADIYKAKKGKYPDTANGMRELITGQYLTNTKDPWGNDFQYMKGSDGKPVVSSYGGDGKPGGEGEGADIASNDAPAP